IPAVHVETVGAAVDLRGAHLDQLNEAPLQATLLDIRLGLLYRLHRGGCCFVGIQSRGLHRALLCDWPQVLAMVQMAQLQVQRTNFMIHGHASASTAATLAFLSGAPAAPPHPLAANPNCFPCRSAKRRMRSS